MAVTMRSYSDAVYKLHMGLVSEYGVKKRNPQKVAIMKSYVERLGLSTDPPGIEIIHVSGTKGKGSTCAFTESVLRCHGYRTGMFTSPHMNEVRERVRLNGKPVSKDMFARYFWEVYDQLESSKSHSGLNKFGGMPAYFNFTVLLALYIFLKEGVQVAVFEVGVGGEYDTTNFFSRPAACGVASLGYDHLTVLGETLDQIAWHKAGIFKKGCPAITTIQDIPHHKPNFQRLAMSPLAQVWGLVWGGLSTLFRSLLWPLRVVSSRLLSLFWSRQEEEKHPMQVIMERAIEKQCPLFVAPPISQEALGSAQLGIAGSKQNRNAALAVQLAKMVINKGRESSLPPVKEGATVDQIPQLATTEKELDEATLKGLTTCYWPGRTEVVKHDGITYYLDGAHNEESIEHCAEWFKAAADKEKQELESKKSGKVVRLLVFNLTKNRNPGNLLRHVVDCDFDEAVFTPQVMSTNPSQTMLDHFDKHLTTGVNKAVPLENRATWDLLSGRMNQPPSLTFPCILEALNWVTQGRDPLVSQMLDTSALGEGAPEVPMEYREATHIQVLVTGSLLLVGPVLGLVKPNMND